VSDGLQKKMDQYNELMLRSTALTFSLEGISRDLKFLLARKAEFVAQIIESTAVMVAAKGHPKSVDVLLDHVLEEVRGTNLTLNYVIMRTLERESAITEVPESKPAVKKKTARTPRKKDGK